MGVGGAPRKVDAGSLAALALDPELFPSGDHEVEQPHVVVEAHDGEVVYATVSCGHRRILIDPEHSGKQHASIGPNPATCIETIG